MADWTTISSLATAGGTLVLAAATFSSVRSSQRSARVAERALLANQRPVLVPSRMEDPTEKVGFADDRWVKVRGGMGEVQADSQTIYLVMALRNVGSGLAVLHGWHAVGQRQFSDVPHHPPEEFRMHTRDIYVPPGATGFWQGAVRDADDPLQQELRLALQRGEGITVELLYGDHEGGQRTISRFTLQPREGSEHIAAVARHWSLDRPDPR
jgi:hypothetical protein